MITPIKIPQPGSLANGRMKQPAGAKQPGLERMEKEKARARKAKVRRAKERKRTFWVKVRTEKVKETHQRQTLPWKPLRPTELLVRIGLGPNGTRRG